MNYFSAFIFGGIICTIGQLFKELYESLGFNEDIVKMAVPSTLIIIAALLTGFKVFDNIAKIAGAGTLVPITGFSNAVVSPAVEFKREGFVLGVGAKMFTIAGPVIVYGTVASVAYGIIYWITTLF
jgi:stage V sporulation protein AC